MEHNPAHHLNIKMALADRAAGGFPDRGKSLRQEIVKAGAFSNPLSEFICLCPNCLIVKA
jgi:hypothetical protein